jgi:hypothetical protein
MERQDRDQSWQFLFKEYAIESETGAAILDHKIVRTVLNQAEYQAFSSSPDF